MSIWKVIIRLHLERAKITPKMVCFSKSSQSNWPQPSWEAMFCYQSDHCFGLIHGYLTIAMHCVLGRGVIGTAGLDTPVIGHKLHSPIARPWGFIFLHLASSCSAFCSWYPMSANRSYINLFPVYLQSFFLLANYMDFFTGPIFMSFCRNIPPPETNLLVTQILIFISCKQNVHKNSIYWHFLVARKCLSKLPDPNNVTL